MQPNATNLRIATDDTPPHDHAAEQAFLGSLAILDDLPAQDRMCKLLWPAAFFDTDHRTMYETLARLIARGTSVDSTTLHAELKRVEALEQIGGTAYIASVLNAVPSAQHCAHYAEIVREHANRREGMQLCGVLSRKLMSPGVDACAEIAKATEWFWKIGQRKGRVDVYTLGGILDEFVTAKREKKASALLTGIPTLDEFAGVFSFGKYTVVGGRPSMGKSTLVRWLLGEWAMAGTPVGLISVEEDRQKIAGNYLSSLTELENDYVAYHEFSKQDFEKATAARAAVQNVPWHGCDSAFSLSEVVAAFDYLVQQKGCKVIGVDHLHLIAPDRHSENEQREIKEISRRLKELGKYHGVVMIVAAQLSRPDKKIRIPDPPTLLDLRASGAIEEHADSVVLLHREDYYRKGQPKNNECELHIEKNRNGRRGCCVLRAELKHQRFAYVARDPFQEQEQ